MKTVILAGGYGTRISEETTLKPKPMVEIVGKPFIYYLIKLLKKRIIQDVLILGGYKYMQIQNYLKDGKHFGLNIEYSIAPEETETGERIKLAYDKLNTVFLLMYSDNYRPLPIDQMWMIRRNSSRRNYIKRRLPATL